MLYSFRSKIVKKHVIYLIIGLCAVFLPGCMPAADSVVSLEGTWKLTNNDRPEYKNKEIEQWVPVELPYFYKLPFVLKDETTGTAMHLPESGYVWIQKKINIEHLPQYDLALHIGEIMNADAAYWNGVLIGSSGRFPPHFKSAWSKFRHYTIPQGIIKKGENLISIRIYYDAEFWIDTPIQLVKDSAGRAQYDFTNFVRIHLMQALFFIMITFAFFFFVMYYNQKDTVEYLFFGLACLAVAFPQLLHFVENLYAYVPFSSNTLLKISQPGLVFFPALLNLFYRYHIGKHSRRILIGYLSAPVILSVIMMLQHSRSDILFIRNICVIISLFYMADLFITSGIQLIKRRKAGLLIFIGIAPMVLLGMHDVLAYGFKVITSHVVLYVYGLPFLIFIIAIYLVNIFVKALRDSKELNIKLRELLYDAKKLAYLEKELEIARLIQQQLLPSSIPKSKGLDIAVKFQPTLSIGGDIYNVFQLRDGVVVFIADVVGHGIPAAMVASMVNILFKMFQMLCIDPGLVLRSLNVNICNMLPQTFVTAACVFINRNEEYVKIARAGHPSIIYQKNRESIEECIPQGKALGLKGENTFETITLPLSPGDALLIYTDGVIEAVNSENAMFGVERLITIMTECYDKSSEEILEAVSSELLSFIGDDANLEDDITLVMIKAL